MSTLADELRDAVVHLIRKAEASADVEYRARLLNQAQVLLTVLRPETKQARDFRLIMLGVVGRLAVLGLVAAALYRMFF
jgi:hypothetical protein